LLTGNERFFCTLLYCQKPPKIRKPQSLIAPKPLLEVTFGTTDQLLISGGKDLI
jgi:hypothetical protein